MHSSRFVKNWQENSCEENIPVLYRVFCCSYTVVLYSNLMKLLQTDTLQSLYPENNSLSHLTASNITTTIHNGHLVKNEIYSMLNIWFYVYIRDNFTKTFVDLANRPLQAAPVINQVTVQVRLTISSSSSMALSLPCSNGTSRS